MIVLKNIGFLQPLLVHASTASRFSEEAKREQISISAQKAAWATSIIKTITEAKLPSTIRDLTLRDEIFNLPDPSNKFEFQVAAKNEVMELFTKGVQLAKPFLTQERIIKGQQSADPHNPSTNQKFIFYPNRMVTTQMFKQLLRASTKIQSNFLLAGGFGISKTVSIILFIHLSYHQTCFIYEASKDEKKRAQYDKLRNLQLIPKTVTKYWYWSVNKNSNQQIKNLIQEQAVELEPEVRAQLKKQSQLLEFMQNLGPHYCIPGISSRPLADQVNTIAQLMRKSNQNLKKIKKIKPDPKPLAVALDKSFRAFLLMEKYYTLTSSAAIERKLLERGYKDILGMRLVDSHKVLQTIHIPYQDIVLTQTGQLDFWQAFWFETERRANLEPVQLQSAKQSFYKNIQRRNLSNTENSKKSTLSAFSRLGYIGEFLSKNNQNLLKSIMSQNQQKFQEIINNFHSFCLKESKQKILNFLESGEKESKQQILLKLYFKAHSLKNKDRYRFSGFLLTIAQLDSILQQNIPSFQTPEVKRLQYEEARKDLSPLLIFQKTQVVKFIFTVEEFILLVEQIISEDQVMSSDYLKFKILKNQGYVSKTVLGLAAEKYIVDCLSKNDGLSYQAYQKSSNISANRVFNIYQVVALDQLENIKEVKQGKSAFEQKFRSAIQISIKYPGEDILALPYKITEDSQIRQDSSNQTMDFVILAYNKKLNKIKIESFDVTDSRDLTQKVLQARNLFTKMFKGVTSIRGKNFQLNHTYLCPKDASYQQYDINNDPPLKIWNADLSDLELATKNVSGRSMFRYIIDLIKLEKENKQYGILLLEHDN